MVRRLRGRLPARSDDGFSHSYAMPVSHRVTYALPVLIPVFAFVVRHVRAMALTARAWRSPALLQVLLLLAVFTSSTIPGWAQSPGTIVTVAGNGNSGFSGDGVQATATSLYNPSSMFVDGAGNLYIADYRNNRIRKVDAVTGIITTVAGGGSPPDGLGDGGPATAASLSLWYPNVVVDAAGNLYLPDYYHRRIRKVDAVTKIITTVAGNGNQGFSGDGGPATAASLYGPIYAVVDTAGNLYISEWNGHRIRKVDAATQIITTVAGNGNQGFSGDGGPATAASIDSPEGIFVDAAGNLYIGDYRNQRIRKVDAVTQIITTVAGGGPNSPGDGGSAYAAVLRGPSGVFKDGAGNLYIADYEDHRIRKVNPTGIITTVAGNGNADFFGDGGPATAASLDSPADVFVDGGGNIYIADTDNNRIRKVIAAPAISSSSSSLNFGRTSVGQTSSQTLTVANPSLVPLAVSGITITGTDAGQFAVSPTSFNVAAGGSQALTVRFTPASGGVKAARLIIQHNAPESQTNIPLTGMGISLVSVSTPSLFGRPNADIMVSIQISGVATATSVYSYSFTLGYGTNGLLENPQVIQEGTLTQDGVVNVNSGVGAGQVRITVARTLPLPNDGVLIKVRFHVSSTATPNDTTRLTLTDVLFNESDPTPTLTNGTFKIARGPFGDITLDGSVSALDASLALQADVGLRTLTAEQITTGDVSGNGGVTAYDAAFILQFVVGQITSFPVQGRSKPLPEGNGPIVSLPQLRANAGDRVTVPVTLSSGRDVRAIGFTLRYDPSSLRFVEVVRGNLPESTQLMVRPDPTGKVSVAGAGTTALPGSGELVRLIFDVIGAPGTQSTLQFERFHANETIVQTGKGTVIVERPIPTAYTLSQNVPNPFNPTTTISYALKQSGHVTLRVYNLLGQVVATLIEGPQEAGVYTVRWNGRTAIGVALAGGVYFYQLQVSGREPFTATRKMLLLK